MYFLKDERLVIFIDGPNLHATMMQLGFEVDYRKLLAFFRSQTSLLRACYYTPLANEQVTSLQPLLDWLSYNGFSTTARPAIEYQDGLGRTKVRSGIYVQMAVDALELSKSIDHFVLFSGNGDFRKLLQTLQEQGRRVSVISTLKSSPPMVADELRRQADQFIDLADLRSRVGR